jgi:hypothetical protein
MKKIIAVLLCFIMLFGCASVVYAKDTVDPSDSEPFTEAISTTVATPEEVVPTTEEVVPTTEVLLTTEAPSTETPTDLETPDTEESSVLDRIYEATRKFIKELLAIAYGLTMDIYDWVSACLG